MIPFPDKKYKVILADPPWEYNDSQKSGGTAYFGASVRYDTMPLDEIKALPVADLADKDCVLFLWVTSPFLEVGFEVIKAWGFKYKTKAFCWSKTTKTGKWVSNMGRWTMGNTEDCLLAVKGHPKREVRNVKQLVIAERTIHSRKPPEVRDRIVQLMGDVPRIELFAREKVDGWDCWGLEAPQKE